MVFFDEWLGTGGPSAKLGPMQRLAIRKRLRRMHRLLVDSRAALERASFNLSNKLLNDLLFMLACRRIIMLNMLDRELGTMGRPNNPGRDAATRFSPYLPEGQTPHTIGLMSACEQEENYLRSELLELSRMPGLPGGVRNMLVSLISEVDEDLRDLEFAQTSLGLIPPR